MPTTYVLTGTDSNLSGQGSVFNKKALAAADGSGTSLDIPLSGGSQGAGAWYTEPDVPNLTSWPAGNYTLSCDIDTSGADITYTLSLRRVSAAGVLLQVLGTSGTLSGTGPKSHTVNVGSPITTNAGDRLVGLLNASRGASHGNQTLTISVNGINDKLIGAWSSTVVESGAGSSAGAASGDIEGGSSLDGNSAGVGTALGTITNANAGAARVQFATNPGDPASATFGATPAAGNLLVAHAAERSGNDAANLTITGSGWIARISETTLPADDAARRTYKVWTKIAGASEPTNVQVDDGTANNKRLLIEEYELGAGEDQFEFLAAAAANSGTGSSSPQSSGTTGSVTGTKFLVIASAIWRNGGLEVPSGFSWSNGLASVVSGVGATNELSIVVANKNDTVQGTYESAVTWSGADSECNAGILVFSTAAGAPSMDGSSSGAGTATGTIVGGSALVGASDGAGAASGDIEGGSALDGSSAGTGAATGVVAGRSALVGSALGAGDASGDIEGGSAMAGLATGSGVANGTIAGASSLIGAASGLGTAAGELQDGASNVAQGAGSSAGVGSATASLVATAPAAGSSSGSSAASADGRARAVAAGASSALAVASAEMRAFLQLDGDSSGAGAVSGTIRDVAGATLSGAGSSSGAGAALGDVVGRRLGAGLSAGIAATAGDIVGHWLGAGLSAAVAAAAASGRATGRMAGSSAGVGAASATPFFDASGEVHERWVLKPRPALWPMFGRPSRWRL